MNVITATHISQGARSGDFDWAVEGELIMFGVVCARDETDPDGGCGCGRAFSGLSSHRATTTAVIRDLPLSRTDVQQALAGYYEAGGWGRIPAAEIADEVDDLLDLAARWPVGTVLERRLDVLRPRAVIAGGGRSAPTAEE